ncbi:MAG TPA: DUF6602 domain-containing protein [Candidatus Paceibacterota bacterium]
MSSATKGGEREDFINKFLAEVMPPPYRFGDGDITDQNGGKSGQVDLVVEFPFLPSIPMIGGSSRLYLAEGVAAVIEVKSSLDSQWKEVEKTATAVKKLERKFGATLSMGNTPQVRIPVFAVGYTGWKEIETLKSKLANKDIDGLLVIDPGLFVSNHNYQGITAHGPWALWGLLQCIHLATSSLKAASANPLDYAR